MDTLHPKASLLLAYADKQLNAEEIIEAETLLKEDPEARVFLETLMSSQLPFAESFDFLLDDKDQSDGDDEEVVLNNPQKQSSWQWPTSIAASLLIGLVVGFALFSFKSQHDADKDNWITDIANYQLLYTRETVTPAPSLSDEEQIALQAKLSNSLKGGLTIPDLSMHKLSFKRGQILDIDGKPLVQLAYLPETGLPLALCILRNDVADTLPTSGESQGLSYIKWSKDGLSYVIIGKTDKKNLEAVALSTINQITI